MAVRKVILFGLGVESEMNHFYLTHDSPYEVVAFTVNQEYIKEDTRSGLPIVPFESIQTSYPPAEHKMYISMAFGKVNKSRAAKYHEAKAKGYELINYISSKAVTWPGLVIGDNCSIYENCVIQPFARIGNNVVIAPGGIVGHHNVVNDHCFLATNTVLLGNVTLEPYCFLGANSTVRDDVTVARECIIGAGVTITKNTRERGVYVNKSPELLPKPSNELATWLTWPAR
jgi:sugar O-acyltransferase (sialic acid O-acetyltransferase NeuD family)